MVWLDVGTGTIVGYRVCLSENKGAVRNSLMDAISRFGTPEHIRVDNGGAYKNVEYAPSYFYNEAQGKKRLTADEKIAKRMLLNGDKGLYENMGIKVHFTIPGNPESKNIEPFWNYCVAPFEKSFPSWIGNKPENRPEIFRNYDNKTLARKYSHMFPTWDEFCEKLEKYVNYYNNKPRELLVTIEGSKLSPLQAYNQIEHTLPNKVELLCKMRDPYIETRVIQRSMIEKNGILYWHPTFASQIGKKIGILYDEKYLHEITICNDKGQIYPEKAIAIDPGLQSGDDLTTMIENNRRVKAGKLCYLSLCDVSGVTKIEKMIKTITSELLPLSNSKQIEYDDVKYLNFEEALDALANDFEDVRDEVNEYQDSNNIDIDLISILKDDIAGLF
jgi:transposase InsO family protein